MVFTYILFLYISSGKGINNLRGKDVLQMLFAMGTFIISVFSIVFIFYANGFLMKRRKKEIALYGILGLEKRHVAIVMFYETVLSGLASILGGCILGVIFSRAFFLMLMKLSRVASGSKFEFEPIIFLRACIFFAIVYLITLLWNLIQVRMSKPIELLKGEEVGQKEKRSTWLIALIGIVCLGAGYYIALQVDNPITALALFFIAVLLVILGTYYTFRAGSVIFLKLLKKNKKYYYQPNHFIIVSGMLHRMKQNATGLANICILSTMVLVTLSTTVGLYIGQEKIVLDANPTDYYLQIPAEKANPDELKTKIEAIGEKYSVTFHDYDDVVFKTVLIKSNKNVLLEVDREQVMNDFGSEELVLITVDEYNRCMSTNESLQKGEVLYRDGKKNTKYDTITIKDTEYKVKGNCENYDVKRGSYATMSDYKYIVMESEKEVLKICKKLDEDFSDIYDSNMEYCMTFNSEGDVESKITCAEEINTYIRAIDKNCSTSNIDLFREQGYNMFGGLVFLGFFLGIVFLLAMVLIIYFKQISEGFDDRKRYEILSKVGLDQKDVKKTINKQIIQVFFLPLLGAIIHVAFAFKMITKMLMIFALTDITMILLCTIGTIALFAVIYVFVFKMTAKAYYRIVRR